MPIATTDASPASPAALDAFLKGVERRAWVLAHAQCGDARAAEMALAVTLMRFRHGAGDLPMARWPLRFWALLLARPEMRQAGGPEAPDALRGLSGGPRAILLLRLVAGLEEDAIAEVLGVSQAAVRMSLVRAMKSLQAPAEQTLAGLHEALRKRVRELPVDRVERLAALRRVSTSGASAGLGLPRPRPRWLMLGLWLALAAVLAAFVASFFLPPREPPLAPGEQRELPLALPTTLSPESAALASPDFDAVLEADSDEVLDDLLFYSWLAGQAQEGGNGE